jgi:membrane protein
VSDSIEGRSERRRTAGFVERVRVFILHDLWSLDLRPRSLTASGVRLLQLGVMIGRGFIRDELMLRASALTYTSLLSLMPLLLVSVSMIGLVGGQDRIIDMFVDQLTAVSPEARDVILGRLRETKIGSLGTVGGTLLIVTAVMTLRHLEKTLNDIWGIRKGRSWPRRFSDYLAVLIVAPILTATAISLSTTMQSAELFTQLLELPMVAAAFDSGLRYLPQLLFTVAFTFLYWFFPNTRIRPFSALLGGVVAMLLFSVARYAYVDLSVGATRYSVIFGGMVALPLMLIWLFVCWAIVLLGAEVAFAHQNLSHYRQELAQVTPGPAEREAVGLRIALEVAAAFCRGHSPPLAGELSESLTISVRTVREMLDALEEAGIVVRITGEDRESAYVPARPVDRISVSNVLHAMRGERRGVGAVARRDALPASAFDEAVGSVLDALDAARAGVGDPRSLADLLASIHPSGTDDVPSETTR